MWAVLFELVADLNELYPWHLEATWCKLHGSGKSTMPLPWGVAVVGKAALLLSLLYTCLHFLLLVDLTAQHSALHCLFPSIDILYSSMLPVWALDLTSMAWMSSSLNTLKRYRSMLYSPSNPHLYKITSTAQDPVLNSTSTTLPSGTLFSKSFRYLEIFSQRYHATSSTVWISLAKFKFTESVQD